MPTFLIDASANLGTNFEPTGYLDSDISDLEDNSYYPDRELDYELELRFSVEGDNEEEARQEAERLLQTLRYRDNDNHWTIYDAEIIEITEVEEQMTLERAAQIWREWTNIANHAVARERPIAVTLTPELMRAIDFIIAYLDERATAIAPMPVGTPVR